MAQPTTTPKRPRFVFEEHLEHAANGGAGSGRRLRQKYFPPAAWGAPDPEIDDAVALPSMLGGSWIDDVVEDMRIVIRAHLDVPSTLMLALTCKHEYAKSRLQPYQPAGKTTRDAWERHFFTHCATRAGYGRLLNWALGARVGYGQCVQPGALGTHMQTCFAGQCVTVSAVMARSQTSGLLRFAIETRTWAMVRHLFHSASTFCRNELIEWLFAQASGSYFERAATLEWAALRQHMASTDIDAIVLSALRMLPRAKHCEVISWYTRRVVGTLTPHIDTMLSRFGWETANVELLEVLIKDPRWKHDDPYAVGDAIDATENCIDADKEAAAAAAAAAAEDDEEEDEDEEEEDADDADDDGNNDDDDDDDDSWNGGNSDASGSDDSAPDDFDDGYDQQPHYPQSPSYSPYSNNGLSADLGAALRRDEALQAALKRGLVTTTAGDADRLLAMACACGTSADLFRPANGSACQAQHWVHAALSNLQASDSSALGWAKVLAQTFVQHIVPAEWSLVVTLAAFRASIVPDSRSLSYFIKSMCTRLEWLRARGVCLRHAADADAVVDFLGAQFSAAGVGPEAHLWATVRSFGPDLFWQALLRALRRRPPPAWTLAGAVTWDELWRFFGTPNERNTRSPLREKCEYQQKV